jgi:Tfp pilus assembly protein PilX
MIRRRTAENGYLLVLTLVFGAIFFVLALGFVEYVITQYRVQQDKYDSERALNIAEAGLEYYKWYLAHYPNDTTNGTGAPGPYVHTYTDPETGAVGSFSLDVSSTTACGEVSSIKLSSTGYTNDNPQIKRTITARYARPTVSQYAYIINSSVWAGSDRTITGPYHSNGVIRMDGTNNSTVSSGQENWVCDGSLPCTPDPNGTTENGVYGDGPNSSLWSFPAPPINFLGLTVDLAAMKDRAENSGGIYFGPSGDYGYLIEFNNNNTINVYRVDGTDSYWGYSTEDGWKKERNVISHDVPVGTYSIPTGCPLIFVEDKVWLQGDVSSKVTLAAADVDTPGVDPSIILNGDITYANSNAGLLAIGENNVLVGLKVPDDMYLNSIFIAQNGRFGRNHYTTSGSVKVPSSLSSYVKRNSLTMNGTIVSNGRVGTKWVSGNTWISGFDTRNNSYDKNLVDNPPPLTPKTSDTYRFTTWQEQ